MPNPAHAPGRRQRLALLDYLDGATHITITCRCGREKIWMTRDLVDKLPGAVTCSNYENRLKCSSCGLKGWVLIRPIPRR
jgi:hypothetical protein